MGELCSSCRRGVNANVDSAPPRSTNRWRRTPRLRGNGGQGDERQALRGRTRARPGGGRRPGGRKGACLAGAGEVQVAGRRLGGGRGRSDVEEGRPGGRL